MICRKIFFLMALCFGIILINACSHVISSDKSLPMYHPEALGEGRVACSECHEDQIRGILKPYASFSHTTVFIKSHRYYVDQDSRLCSSCHAQSFCTDCHANETEIKPSLKLGDRPDRELIHRGDFLTRHQIEGKIDPTGCYRCHGRANNEKCFTCHK
jgi:hypothetical protein